MFIRALKYRRLCRFCPGRENNWVKLSAVDKGVSQ